MGGAKTRTTEIALGAWRRATETLVAFGILYSGLIMHYDRDPMHTGYRWTSRLLSKDAGRISFALRGVKDNPEMETFNGGFKTEPESLLCEGQRLEELVSMVEKQVVDYSVRQRHSWLNHVAPLTFIGSVGAAVES